MSSQEVLTIQLGNYSNHVGTHYWNLQHKRLSSYTEDDERYSSKLFRETSECKGSNFVPRLVCFDIKGSLKALKEDGSFQEDENDVEMTEEEEQSDHTVYAQPRHSRTDVSGEQQEANYLDEKVNSWSDFMVNRLHENTVQLLTKNYDNGKEFTYFGVGQNEYKSLFDDIEDKLHFWVEECNGIEGFQVFTDMHDGFSGLTSKLLEDLQDEYSKKCTLNYINWMSMDYGKNDVYRDLNIALTFQALKEHSSLFALQSLEKDIFNTNSGWIQIPNVEYKGELKYHTSAILAATIDSTTLPWREKHRKTSMSELCYHISQGKWKLAGTSLSLSYMNQVESSCTLFDVFNGLQCFYPNLMSPLCPVMQSNGFLPFTQSIVLQNIDDHSIRPSEIKNTTLQTLGLNQNIFTNNPLTVMDFFTEKIYPIEQTISKSFYSSEQLDCNVPFPSIIKTPERSVDMTTMSSMFTTANFYDILHELVKRVQKINLQKHPEIVEFGLDQDLMKELQEDLIMFCKDYDPQRTFDEIDC